MVPMATYWKMGILLRLVITNVHDQIMQQALLHYNGLSGFFWRGLLILRMDIRKGARVNC